MASPRAYFERARELGLRCLAITEHHNIDSLGEVMGLAAEFPDIQVVVGAELSVNTSIGPVDLLCYNLPRRPVQGLATVLQAYRSWQQEYGNAFSKGMQALGFDYSDEARRELLRSYRPEKTLAVQGITHVKNAVQRKAFVEKGYITDTSEYAALQQRVREKVALPNYPDVGTVVTAVKEAGGVVAIAHPPRYFLEDDLSRMDLLRKECQLDGIECAHRGIKPALTPFYREYSREHGLFSVGGSDSHEDIDVHPPEGAIDLGTKERAFARHLGEESWLDEFLERLEKP